MNPHLLPHLRSSKHVQATKTQYALLLNRAWSLRFWGCLEPRSFERGTLSYVRLMLLGRPPNFLFRLMVRIYAAAFLIWHDGVVIFLVATREATRHVVGEDARTNLTHARLA